VGTGIGGGIIARGKPVHGALHPELGHIPAPRLSLPDGGLDGGDVAQSLAGLANGRVEIKRRGEKAVQLEPTETVCARIQELISAARGMDPAGPGS
jgi:fructokinase